MPSVTEVSGYVVEPLREGRDFILYRGRQDGNPSPVLALAVAEEQPSPQSLRRLEHECSLAAELDPAWAVRPLALTRHEGRTILILTNPGGNPLGQLLERDQGQPLDLTRVLRIAVGLATALGQIHWHGIHIRTSSQRMCSSMKPAMYGSPDSGLRPNCRTSASRPYRSRSLPVPSLDGARTDRPHESLD
jgi:hypothetical protein